MNQSQTIAKTASRTVMSHDDTLHLHEPWLALARASWLIIVVSAYTLFVANIPAYVASLYSLHAPGGNPFTVRLTIADVHTLQNMGLSLSFYVTGMVGVSLLFQFTYAAVGALLFWRKSDERAALLTSFAMMMLPFGFATITLQALPSTWSWLIPMVSALGNGSLLLSAYVFPDGRFIPHWTRWLALMMVGYWVEVVVSPSWQLDRSTPSLGIFFGFIVAVPLIQVYRYRYVSTPRQRQQTKWVLLAIVLAAVGNIGARLLYYLVLLPRSQGSPLAYAFEVSLIMCSMLPIPLALGIAILSSHLWDIDVLINRTLVYSILTLTLASIYVCLVITLQFFLRELTGQIGQSPFVVMSSTLVIAALFQPVRQRIQKIIDRRFYRHKYDAARTLTDFNATLHHEVDLVQLSEQLVAVVEETMQPTFVSLWLRTAENTKSWKTRRLPRLDEEEGKSQQE